MQMRKSLIDVRRILSGIHISSNVSLNSIALYDILGKLILRKVKDTNSIDVSNLNAGVYILVMHSENEKAIKKVTVK